MWPRKISLIECVLLLVLTYTAAGVSDGAALDHAADFPSFTASPEMGDLEDALANSQIEEMTEKEYEKRKAGQLKRIEEGGYSDPLVEQMMAMVNENDEIRKELKAEAAATGDILSEFQELLNSENENEALYDKILSEQVDHTLAEAEDEESLAKLVKDAQNVLGSDTSAELNSILHGTRQLASDISDDETKPLNADAGKAESTELNEKMMGANELMEQVQRMMAQMKEQFSVDEEAEEADDRSYFNQDDLEFLKNKEDL
jgi:hypothetical protein|eukprot:Stramenopile-MAST_4_protein_518